MARYMALIYGDEGGLATASPEETEQMAKEYNAFTDEARSAGVFEAGDGLQPTPAATTVRVRDGKLSTHGRSLRRDVYTLPSVASSQVRGASSASGALPRQTAGNRARLGFSRGRRGSAR
jgi:hypothetical protein